MILKVLVIVVSLSLGACGTSVNLKYQPNISGLQYQSCYEVGTGDGRVYADVCDGLPHGAKAYITVTKTF